MAVFTTLESDPEVANSPPSSPPRLTRHPNSAEQKEFSVQRLLDTHMRIGFSWNGWTEATAGSLERTFWTVS